MLSSSHIYSMRCSQIGGTNMFEILFESPKEAETICSIFRSICKENQLKINQDDPESIQLLSKKWDESVEQLIIRGIIHYIIEHKEQEVMLSIIQNHFYFEDHEEQQQILHIAQSIIEGDRSEIPQIQKFQHRETYLKEALQQFLRPNLSFSFHSFFTFRLQDYLKRLQRYVEVAIEEYKLEQEYQNFIQTLRDYITVTASKLDAVKIHHDEQFTIYNRAGIEMSENELKQYIDTSFIKKQPHMYIDCELLAPLVCISPKKIILYTDEPDAGMNQTIQNIFQERVQIFPKSQSLNN